MKRLQIIICRSRVRPPLSPDKILKILFLNNYYYLRGGSERVLFEEIRLLQQAGHEVAVYSRSHPNNESSAYQDYFPQDLNNTNFRLHLRAIATVKELIYSRSAREGASKVIDKFQPDLVHAHNIYGRLSTSVLDLMKERRIPTVLSLHDLKLVCPSYLMLNHGRVCERCKGNRFYNAVITKCHKDSYMASTIYALETWFNHTFKKYDSVKYFITPSRFLRNKIIEFGWNAKKLVHIPNFIDKCKLPISHETGDYALFLGRLSREKGVITLLQALQVLTAPIRLVIAGDGPDRQALQNMASEHALPVTFTGYLQGGELERTISGSRVVILPSECYENAPLSVLEAFSYGKPVIGARIGGIPEMIEDGINGYLFEPGKVTDLQDKWSTFLKLPSERVHSMGQNARKTVEKNYSSKSHYRQLMAVYHKALGAQ